MRARRAALVALVVATATAPADAAAGRITVARTAVVAGPAVRLGDVAALEGEARDLAALELGPAPAPGGSRQLDGLGILHRLHAAGVDEQATVYQIPASVRVTRAFQEVGSDTLRAAVEREAATLLAPGESLRDVDVTAPVRIPPGPYDVRVGPPTPTRGRHRRLDVTLVQGDDTVATVPLRVEVSALAPVVTARRAVARGAVLGSDDLALEERDLADVPASALGELRQALGKEARTSLAAGTVLTVQALSSPPLVRRGDVVALVIETPAMRLSLPGEALESGAAGAPVRVRNRSSQQEVVGQVVERGTVLVQY